MNDRSHLWHWLRVLLLGVALGALLFVGYLALGMVP